jgi:hypothetical protein
MNPFDYVNAINYSKEDLITPDPKGEENYKKASFMVNRTLGKFVDTIFPANEMNVYNKLDPFLKYQFFINIVRKKKRFLKEKAPTKSEHIAVIKEYYGYSETKARDVLELLTDEQLIELKRKVHKGGTSRPKN